MFFTLLLNTDRQLPTKQFLDESCFLRIIYPVINIYLRRNVFPGSSISCHVTFQVVIYDEIMRRAPTDHMKYFSVQQY